MTVMLDKVLTAGGTRVVAIVRLRVVPKGWRGGAVFRASKEPLAVLLARGDRIEGVAMDGTAMTMDEVEAICPGAMARFAGGEPFA